MSRPAYKIYNQTHGDGQKVIGCHWFSEWANRWCYGCQLKKMFDTCPFDVEKEKESKNEQS